MNEITLETKIADLLNDYEGMKDILIEINPKFKKLNNPILRRTLAKVAGVRQAAIVGGMDPYDLLNQLRQAVGQTPVTKESDETTVTTKQQEPTPQWVADATCIKIDANALLEAEKNPLAEVQKELRKLQEGEVVCIVSDFKPQPLIDEFQQKGHRIYVKKINEELFHTYIV